MNAVEIEQAVSELAERSFDSAEFPYAFLQAFGNKETTIRKLKNGDTNKSDLGGVLQRNNIHIAIAPRGDVAATLEALRASPATTRHKVKFILATDGEWLEAEELGGGTPLACEYVRLPDFFGFFLPLAGISTVREIVENAFDIRATSKLNRLYVELLKENPEWGTDERRHDMNHFMARLIFSFFAEDTGIFAKNGQFTSTVSQMSEKDSSNTDEVIGALFRAMNTKLKDREAAGIPRWASDFPYVNGGLFSGEVKVPRFTRTARSYLIQVGSLDWKRINPDIFGSMIQAVANDEERGALGMHYTSVPNILKVLNPLFLDDLRAALNDAGDNSRKLFNLRNRIKRIRVFDPACGSGNFLVIAYKEMRKIEDEINQRRGEHERKTEIPLTNFRGIELRDFAAQIARLALIIAQFQCDELYRGQQEALHDVLPLDEENWIVRGNALRLDWLSVCPPTGTGVKLVGEDLFSTPLDQSEIDFEYEGGETYICGNPPYLGSKRQTVDNKADMHQILSHQTTAWRSLDYVAGWYIKASEHSAATGSTAAFVSTNSLWQGQQVPILWPLIAKMGIRIVFAVQSFHWSNLAAHNAGVTVAIVGVGLGATGPVRLYNEGDSGLLSVRLVTSISPYLFPGDGTVVVPRRQPIGRLPALERGGSPTDGGNLLMDRNAMRQLVANDTRALRYVRRYVGSQELIDGVFRYCLWIPDREASDARSVVQIADRLERVKVFRQASTKLATIASAASPHRFQEPKALSADPIICIPVTSSEQREFLPVDILPQGTVASNLAFYTSCPPSTHWVVSVICAKLLRAWVAGIGARMRTDLRFTNTVCWNTFPVPPLSAQNKTDLTRCAEDILLAREAHYPATIADLYDPERMPANLREAHERNDEVLERIYIGRKFRNDTERLEKLFDMYSKMTASKPHANAKRSRRKNG